MSEFILNERQTSAIDYLKRCVASGDRIETIAAECGLKVGELVPLIEGRVLRVGGHVGTVWEAEMNRLYAAVIAWHERAHRSPPFAPTPTGEQIKAAIQYAHSAGKCVSIIGGVGIGKTVAQIEYCRMYPRTTVTPGAQRVVFTKGCDHGTNALWAVYCALTNTESRSSQRFRLQDIQDQIANLLREGDALLFDEVNYVGDAVDHLRDIYDRMSGWGRKVGMVFLGNPQFGKDVYSSSERHSAFANRAMRFSFPSSTADDVLAWCEWAGGGWRDNAVQAYALRVGVAGGKFSGLRVLADLREFLAMNDPERCGEPEAILGTLGKFFPEAAEPRGRRIGTWGA